MHQDVDWAEVGLRALEQRGDLACVREVGLERNRASARCTNRVRDFLTRARTLLAVPRRQRMIENMKNSRLEPGIYRQSHRHEVTGSLRMCG